MRARRVWPMRNTARGVSGSSREGSSAGNSHRPLGLLRNPPKGVK